MNLQCLRLRRGISTNPTLVRKGIGNAAPGPETADKGRRTSIQVSYAYRKPSLNQGSNAEDARKAKYALIKEDARTGFTWSKTKIDDGPVASKRAGEEVVTVLENLVTSTQEKAVDKEPKPKKIPEYPERAREPQPKRSTPVENPISAKKVVQKRMEMPIRLPTQESRSVSPNDCRNDEDFVPTKQIFQKDQAATAAFNETKRKRGEVEVDMKKAARRIDDLIEASISQ